MRPIDWQVLYIYGLSCVQLSMLECYCFEIKVDGPLQMTVISCMIRYSDKEIAWGLQTGDMG